MLCVLLSLTACRVSPYSADGSVSVPPADHSHPAPAQANVVEHEPEGYCGNTTTVVRYVPLGGDGWEYSFWGGTSVELTDFLRWLDYSGEVCRCLPEYYVKTEFGKSEYGVSLSGGYVRYQGGQVQLAQEQVEELSRLLQTAGSMKQGGFFESFEPAE